MDESVKGMLRNLRKCLGNSPNSKECAEKVFREEERMDMAQAEVIGFLTELLSTSVSQSIANDAERQLRMSDDLETASDYVTQVLKLHLRLKEHNVAFDKMHQENLFALHDMVAKLADDVSQLLVNQSNVQLLSEIRKEGHAITQKCATSARITGVMWRNAMTIRCLRRHLRICSVLTANSRNTWLQRLRRLRLQ